MDTNKENKASEKEVDEKDQKIQTLEAELAEMKAMMKELMASKKDGAPKDRAVVQVTAPTTDVTLVYLDDCPGLIQCGDISIRATKMGEEFVLSRTQFDIVVGKYRHWFEKGILAVGDDSYEIAVRKGLKTASEYNFTSDELERLGSMTGAEIKKFWKGLKTQGHREAVVCYFKKHFIEDTPGFRDRERLDVLDSLTGGAFDRERSELLGKFTIERTVVSLAKDE